MATRTYHLANVVVSQLNMAVVMAGSFIVTPAILHGLGDSAYGGWLLINSFVQYMRFFDMGMSMGSTKYGAAAIEREDDAELRKVLDTSMAIFVVMGTLGILATAGLTQLLPRMYPTVAAGQGMAIAALGVALSLDLYCRPFSATIRMRSLFFVHDGIELVTYCVFKLGLVLYFAYTGRLSYTTLALITLGETTLRVALVAGISMVKYPSSRRMNPVRWDRALFKAFVSLGAMWTLVTVAEIICFQLDAGVIGYFLPEDPLNISIFGVGMRLPSVAFMSVGVIGGVLMPKFSGLSAKGDHAAVMALLTRANVATVLAAALLLVNLGVLGPQFLELWLHKPWVVTSGRIMMMMLPAYFIALLGVPANNLLIGVARLRGLAMLTLGEAAVNFGLSVALVKPLGIWGVGLGTALPLALFRGVLFPYLLRRELGIQPREYFGAMKRALLVAVLYLAAVSPLSFVPVPTFTRFVLLGSGSVVVFAAIVLALVPQARVEASKRLSRLRRRPAA